MKLIIRVALALSSAASVAAAQGAYYEVHLADLDLAELSVPVQTRPWQFYRSRELTARWPRVVIEGSGTGYFDLSGGTPAIGNNMNIANGLVAIQAPAGDDVRGTLFLPVANWEAMAQVPLRLSSSAASPAAAGTFEQAKRNHYQRHADSGFPGQAWFRHLARGTDDDAATVDLGSRWRVTPSDGELTQSFSLFSGGRALSENLQLERTLPESDAAEETVALASIRGVTVREFDWEPHLTGVDAAADPLAALVPEDQHALFFASFADMVTLLDETRAYGAPVLVALESRSQNARTLERYQRQLCLPLDGMARLLGPLVIRSVAMTGSDPYLRTGSDVAVLFEAVAVGPLRAHLRTQQDQARSSDGARQVTGEVDGVAYEGVVSPSRRVCSYVATVGETVIVTNSLVQLRRLVSVANGNEPALDATPDYRFFRRRYSRGDDAETGFLLVPDAAIRRWCGPRWRIATSRRTMAAALLAEYQAIHLAELVAGVDGTRALPHEGNATRLGDLTLTADGVRSAAYGTSNFLTPIVEQSIERATEQEARFYKLWRDGYESNWSNFFDPIAIRFTVSESAVAIDLSVIPLILDSDYRDWAEVCGQTKLASGGDPHPESIAHFAMAIDPDSEPVRGLGELFSSFFAKVGASPFSWLGHDLALYADSDPFWSDLAETEDLEEMMENVEVDLNDMPIVLHVGVSSGLKLALFLTTIRALSDDTVPGMLKWETREVAEDVPYVCVTSKNLFDDYTLFYAATPRAFLLGFNEPALRRAVKRAYSRLEADPSAEPTPSPWLGESVAIDIRREALALHEVISGETFGKKLQIQSWRSLPILNEWRRLYPARDSVDLHAEFWGEELRCPVDGSYTWNESWQTYESTAYGHPGEPKVGPQLPQALRGVQRFRAGLTFELDGLRARAELQR